MTPERSAPGITRGFFLVVDPARRVACQCKSDERVTMMVKWEREGELLVAWIDDWRLTVGRHLSTRWTTWDVRSPRGTVYLTPRGPAPIGGAAGNVEGTGDEQQAAAQAVAVAICMALRAAANRLTAERAAP